MKRPIATAMILVLSTSSGGYAQDSLTVVRSAVPSRPAPAENFTGTIRVGGWFQAQAPARTYGAAVAFEPGARTYWHTHPLGQTLVVTSGTGRVQHWGGPVQEIRPGDVVRIPPGVKHWHGAAPDAPMIHVALRRAAGGRAEYRVAGGGHCRSVRRGGATARARRGTVSRAATHG
jgi:4-carboxymuconolactone decarboxylase